MKIFTALGIWVAALSLLGMLGIGHFRLYYGKDLPNATWCSKGK